MINSASIFADRETFLAVSANLFENPQASIKYLKKALLRMRNPPIAITYTVDLLPPAPITHYSLAIIRFISQLADLSKGTSISDSLQGLIEQSGFLSEVRHSLTHKHMVSDQIILKARQIILRELEVKYWRATEKQILQEGAYDYDIVMMRVEEIYGERGSSYLTKKTAQRIMRPHRLSLEDLRSCGMYVFKKRVSSWLQHLISQEDSGMNIADMVQFVQSLSQFKKSILFSALLGQYSKTYKNEYLYELIVKLIVTPRQAKVPYTTEARQHDGRADGQLTGNSNNNQQGRQESNVMVIRQQCLKQGYILKKLRKIKFFEFVGNNALILKKLPELIRAEVEEPFDKAVKEGFTFFKTA